MNRTTVSLLIFATLALILGACVAPAPAAHEEPMESEAAPMADEEAGEMAESDSEAEFERILACVQENFPAESYFTNELLPAAGAAWEPMECDSVDSIKVGMPWVLVNGQIAIEDGQATGALAGVVIKRAG